LPFKQWDTVFPNAACAVALIDRLTHHAEIVSIEGESYRSERRSRHRSGSRSRNRNGDHAAAALGDGGPDLRGLT
jgi:hypothetical protein